MFHVRLYQIEEIPLHSWFSQNFFIMNAEFLKMLSCIRRVCHILLVFLWIMVDYTVIFRC